MNKFIIVLLALLLVGSVSAYICVKNNEVLNAPNYIKLYSDSSHAEVNLACMMNKILYEQDKENGYTDEQIQDKINLNNKYFIK